MIQHFDNFYMKKINASTSTISYAMELLKSKLQTIK